MDANKELNKAFDVVINRLNEIARRDNYSSGISYAIEVNYQSAITNLPMSENTYGQFNHFKWTTWQWDYSWVFFDSIERAILIVTDDEMSYDDFYQDYLIKYYGEVGTVGDFQHAIMLPINEWVEEEVRKCYFNGFEVDQMYWLTNIPEYEYFLNGQPEAKKENIVGAIKVVRVTEKCVFYELVGRPQYQRIGSDKPYKASLQHFFAEPLPYFKPDKSLNWTWEYTDKGHRKNKIAHSCFSSHKINLADPVQSEIVDNLWPKTNWQFEVGKTYQHLRIKGLAIQVLERDDQKATMEIQKYYDGVKSGEPETDAPTYRTITMKWPGIEIWDCYSADVIVNDIPASTET